MLNYSQLRNCYYYDSEVIHISNIKQVQKYINAGVIDDLIDIKNGDNNKLVLVFKKTEQLHKLYKLWNKREL